MRKSLVAFIAVAGLAGCKDLRDPNLGSSESANTSMPPAADVGIRRIDYGGSGCPNGTVGQSISNDRKTSPFRRGACSMSYCVRVRADHPGLRFSSRASRPPRQ